MTKQYILLVPSLPPHSTSEHNLDKFRVPFAFAQGDANVVHLARTRSYGRLFRFLLWPRASDRHGKVLLNWFKADVYSAYQVSRLPNGLTNVLKATEESTFFTRWSPDCNGNSQVRTEPKQREMVTSMWNMHLHNAMTPTANHPGS